MAFSFFSGSQKEHLVLALDIGSASVGGALVELKEGVPPRILWSLRRNMFFDGELNFGKFTAAMIKALDEVLREFGKRKARNPKYFYCILASPWYVSETRISRMENASEFTVAKGVIEKLLAREVDSFSRSYKTSDYRKASEAEVEVIESQLMQVKLNGYEIAEPYGKSARNLELAVHLGVGSKSALLATRKKISQYFNAREAEFFSFPLVAYTVIRDIFSHIPDFLFLDISGEVTDVSLVRQGVLLETVSFPRGKKFLLRKLAEALGTVQEEAESLFRMWREGKVDGATKGKIDAVLADAQNSWVHDLSAALNSFSSGLYLPHQLFFTADDDVEQVFSDFIRKEEFAQTVLTIEPFSIRFIDGPSLAAFCAFEGSIARDPFLILTAIYADRKRYHARYHAG